MARAHLFIPHLRPGDAAGAHTIELRRLLDELGHPGELFVQMADAGTGVGHRRFASYGTDVRAAADDVLIYQLAIGSVMADFLLARPERLVVNFHNFTPVEFFAPWEPHLVSAMLWGRHQAEALAPRTELAIGVSAFNTAELDALGFAATATAPFLWDPTVLPPPAVDGSVPRTGSGGARWLFVGRLAPNKCQHDLIKALAAHRHFWDPDARLDLVGGSSSPHYEAALRSLVDALDLVDAVTFSGAVDAAGLARRYAEADVFVCLSEHEGFCVPLLEAMHHGVPVVAFDAAAIADTMGPGGLLLDEKSPLSVAAAVERVVGDDELRSTLVGRGRARVESLSLSRGRARYTEVLAPVLGSPEVTA